MNDATFERELFAACDGFWGARDWRDKRGWSYDRIMDNIALNCTPEQWLIVDETMSLLRDPDFITGEVSLDTPVSPNEWENEAS